MKKTFIAALADKQTSFTDNQAQFEQLKQIEPNLFQPFNSEFIDIEQHQHRWNAIYFATKITDLGLLFSKELVEHLIEVKQYLQQQGKDGFSLVGKAELPNAIVDEKTVSQDSLLPKEDTQAVLSSSKTTAPDLSNFKPKERLANFIRAKELDNVRSELMSSLNNRRMNIEEVVKSVWYVYQQLPAVFVEPEDSAFVQEIDHNQSHWNIDYFSLQQVYLNRNFTLERLLHLINVRETLLKAGDKDFQQIQVNKPVMEESEKREEYRRNETNSSGHYQPKQTTSSSSSMPRSHTTSNNHRSQDNHTESEENGFVKTAMLVGGAVLAVVAVLFAIFK